MGIPTANHDRFDEAGDNIVIAGMSRLFPGPLDLASHWRNTADKSACNPQAYEIWRADERISKLPTDRGRDELDVLAHRILSSQEQAEYASAIMPDKRRREWLAGRAVAKQAVSKLLVRRRELRVAPVDIAIIADGRGRPYVAQGCIPGLSSMPEISIAHTNGIAVAVVVDGNQDVRVGIDIERFRQLNDGFARRAFVPAELQWLSGLTGKAANERMLQLWCVKEAAVKALGLGFEGKPQTYVITRFNVVDGYAEVDYVEARSATETVSVTTRLHDGLIWALATHSRG